MKTVIKSVLFFLGFEIRRTSSIRNSMQKSLKWLKTNNFRINTVLDVGASDGRWSKDCMKYFPDINYVLYEPQPLHFVALDLMKEKLGDRINIVKKAVGQNSGVTYFDVSTPYGGSIKNSGSINTEEVILTTIDQNLNDIELNGPFLLKLDTHGFEIPILEGASKTLENCEILIIEAYNFNIEPDSVLFWQLCDYLQKKGFRPIDLVDIMYREFDNSLWQMDIIFIKSSWLGFRHITYS